MMQAGLYVYPHPGSLCFSFFMDANAYFSAAHKAFCQAQVQQGNIEYWYKIGGYIICQRFAGQALIPQMTEALSHLQISPCSSADLTICLWDSSSTGIAMPSPPWSVYDYGDRGLVNGYNCDRFCTLFQVGPDVLHLFDRDRQLALYWVKTAAQIPYWEHSFPLRIALHWWTRSFPLQLVHAGAVGTQTGCVLLTGKSGSGKSTTTLACLEAGLLYLGDDYVMIQTEPISSVYSLYNTAKLEASNLWRFPNLANNVSNLERLNCEKALIFLHNHRPEQLISHLPIRAVLTLEISHQENSSLQKRSPSESFAALAPTTTFHLPRYTKVITQKIAALVNQVPNYRLILGTNLKQIPEAVLSLL